MIIRQDNNEIGRFVHSTIPSLPYNPQGEQDNEYYSVTMTTTTPHFSSE